VKVVLELSIVTNLETGYPVPLFASVVFGTCELGMTN